MRTPGSAADLARVRMLAAQMFEQKLEPKQIAARILVNAQTVRRWRRLWSAQGPNGLKPKRHPGRPARLTLQQKRSLIDVARRSPIEFGFTRRFWTTSMFRDVIKESLGVEYRIGWVREILYGIGIRRNTSKGQRNTAK